MQLSMFPNIPDKKYTISQCTFPKVRFRYPPTRSCGGRDGVGLNGKHVTQGIPDISAIRCSYCINLYNPRRINRNRVCTLKTWYILDTLPKPLQQEYYQHTQPLCNRWSTIAKRYLHGNIGGYVYDSSVKEYGRDQSPPLVLLRDEEGVLRAKLHLSKSVSYYTGQSV